MVRERSDPVPVRTGGASPVRTAERSEGGSGACSERRPAQTARIRGGDADTAARRPGQGGEKSKFHDRRARNAQTHGFPPGVTDHPAPMWLTGCPASCPPLRHVPFGCSTFDRRLRSDRDVGRDRQGGRREGRKACGSAARCPGIVRIGLTVLPASHRMAARGRETGERIDRPNPWGSAGQGGRAFPPRRPGMVRALADMDSQEASTALRRGGERRRGRDARGLRRRAREQGRLARGVMSGIYRG